MDPLRERIQSILDSSIHERAVQVEAAEAQLEVWKDQMRPWADQWLRHASDLLGTESLRPEALSRLREQRSLETIESHYGSLPLLGPRAEGDVRSAVAAVREQLKKEDGEFVPEAYIRAEQLLHFTLQHVMDSLERRVSQLSQTLRTEGPQLQDAMRSFSPGEVSSERSLQLRRLADILGAAPLGWLPESGRRELDVMRASLAADAQEIENDIRTFRLP